MRLKADNITMIQLKPVMEPLTDREQKVADYIARCLRENRPLEEPVGLFIWRLCRMSRVDHHRIARHLGMRKHK